MKSRIERSLMRRVNSQGSLTTTCKASNPGTSYWLFLRTIWQHSSIVLFLLLSMEVGLGSATAQAQARAYVTNEISGDVSVIDTATNTVLATIPVGGAGFGVGGVAITPDGTRAYVMNTGPNTVVVIDTATNTVVKTIPWENNPFSVAITPDGTRAYVTNEISGRDSGTVSVLDSATNTVVATIVVGADPVGIAITPDGTRAYVTTEGASPGISVIDTATNTVVATIPPFLGIPYWVVITPDGTRAYVTNIGPTENNVWVLDTATSIVVDIIPVGGSPTGVAITPDGTRAYVANGASNTVSVLDTPSNTVVTTIAVGKTPFGVAITPDGTQAYVTDETPNTVSVIDTATNTVVGSIAVGANPFGVAISRLGILFSCLKGRLELDRDEDEFDLVATFNLGSGGSINPRTQPVTLTIGTYAVTIPAGSFVKHDGRYHFKGVIKGVRLDVLIRHLRCNEDENEYHSDVEPAHRHGCVKCACDADSFKFLARGKAANLKGIPNPVTVTISVGANNGATKISPEIER